MRTNLERIAAKARKETSLQFTSLAHHITKELIWESLKQIPQNTAPGVDGITVGEALEDFRVWVDGMITSIHRKSYKPPAVRRVWIPKPGKTEKRPIGVNLQIKPEVGLHNKMAKILDIKGGICR